MEQRKDKNSCIADAFERVVSANAYHNCWVTDNNFSRIIRHEYDIPFNSMVALDGKILVAALKSDKRYSLADQGAGVNGVFCKVFTPRTLMDGLINQGHKQGYCYFVTDKGCSLPSVPNGRHWYDMIVNFPRLLKTKECAIGKDEKRNLLRRLTRDEEEATTEKTIVDEQGAETVASLCAEADTVVLSWVTPLANYHHL